MDREQFTTKELLTLLTDDLGIDTILDVHPTDVGAFGGALDA